MQSVIHAIQHAGERCRQQHAGARRDAEGMRRSIARECRCGSAEARRVRKCGCMRMHVQRDEEVRDDARHARNIARKCGQQRAGERAEVRERRSSFGRRKTRLPKERTGRRKAARKNSPAQVFSISDLIFENS